MVNKKSSQDMAIEWKNKATKFFQKGKLDQALDAYLKLWKLDPKDFRVQMKIGDVLLKMNRKNEAIAVYKKVAEAYGKDGFLIQGISVCKIVLKLDSQESQIKKLLASLYAERGMIRDSENAGGNPTKAFPEKRKSPSKDKSEDLLEEFFSEDLVVSSSGLPVIPLFSHLEKSAFEALIDSLTPWRVPANTVICKEGDPSESMFVIAQGSLRVETLDSKGKSLKLAVLNPGEFFGEIGLFSSLPRTATCVAIDEMDLLEIKRIEFEKIVQKFPKVKTVLHEFYTIRILDTVLAKSVLFGALSLKLRKELARRFKPKEADAGAMIIKEGKPSTHLYMIRDGIVEVFTHKNAKEVALAQLKVGEFFGEVGLFTGKMRTASIRAKTKVDLICLGSEDFQWVLQQSPEALKVIKTYIDKRVESTIKKVMEDQ